MTQCYICEEQKHHASDHECAVKFIFSCLIPNVGQKDKGRASPPPKVSKFQAALSVSNGDVPMASNDGFESGQVGPLSGFQEEELCIGGIL